MQQAVQPCNIKKPGPPTGIEEAFPQEVIGLILSIGYQPPHVPYIFLRPSTQGPNKKARTGRTRGARAACFPYVVLLRSRPPNTFLLLALLSARNANIINIRFMPASNPAALPVNQYRNTDALFHTSCCLQKTENSLLNLWTSGPLDLSLPKTQC